jgi:hypothetical protein
MGARKGNPLTDHQKKEVIVMNGRRNWLVFLGVLILGIALLLAYSFFPSAEVRAMPETPAARHTPGAWDRWNIDPYATDKVMACQLARLAIDGFHMPTAVKTHFKRVVGTTCTGGKSVWITPGQQFEEMWSGSGLLGRLMVGKIPVTESPDGRPYRSGAVAEAANALEWSYTHGGRTYILDLPFVCFNWAWRFGATVASPPPAKPSTPKAPSSCRTISYNGPVGGQARWGDASTDGPLPASACNALQQGGGVWEAWYGHCDWCQGAIGYIRSILGSNAEIYHKFLYRVRERRQTLRFSTAVTTDVVYICLEDADGRQSRGVYVRPEDWVGKTHIEIPDSMWQVDPNHQ